MARAVIAVLFDMGGTLDGDGLHWLNRFDGLYAEAGLPLPRERLRAAFDDAERRAAVDESMATAHLDAMVDQHVAWQLAYLDLDPPALRQVIVERFAAAVRATAARNVRMLADLAARGFKLGVVSNGCGNVDVLCGDLGYAPHLTAIVDSRRAGLYKPDPAIFIHAAARVGVAPANTLMVGDSIATCVRRAAPG
jgi:FMN phosphatase YigB (HAD superfamily)